MKYKILAFTNILQELNYVLNKQQKRKSFIILAVIIISSSLDMFSISALLPFIQGIMNINTLNTTWYGALVTEVFNTNNNFTILVILGVFIILVYLIKNIFLFLSIKIQTGFRCNTIKELSLKIFNSYMRRPYSFFLDINSAEFMRGINDDVVGIFFILDELFSLVKNLSTALFIGAFIIYSDFIMAFGLLLISVVCIFSIQAIFGSKIGELRNTLRAANKEQYQAAYQAISGIKDIKVMQRSEYFIHQYEKAYDKKKNADYGYCLIKEVPARGLEVACVFALIVTLCIRIKIGTDPAIFIPKLATFALAVFQIVPIVGGISNNLNGLSYKKASLDAAYNNLREVSIYDNSRIVKQLDIKYDNNCNFKNSIEIQGISWQYSKKSRQILNNVNFKISKGESIALIGASGAGKTTLADIILGLLEPANGHIFMDGIDIYTIPHIWSETIGYVPQSVFLLDDTIKNNVVFGKDNVPISDEAVWHALDEAQLKDYIMSLPDKLDTTVGERGVKLSGGQRQRIAIARALYYNPQILVLDEATSALDNDTEQAVMQAIEHLHGSKTLIIIAHRLSTIKDCDRIYEIVDGMAIERKKEDIFING